MVPPTRIERATNGLGNRCSIQLSYGGYLRMLKNPSSIVLPSLSGSTSLAAALLRGLFEHPDRNDSYDTGRIGKSLGDEPSGQRDYFDAEVLSAPAASSSFLEGIWFKRSARIWKTP